MTTTWFLIIYLSSGFATVVTGGPTVAPQMFKTQEECENNGARLVNSIPKADWYHCDFIVTEAPNE